MLHRIQKKVESAIAAFYEFRNHQLNQEASSCLKEVKVIAHRGLGESDLTENTLQAFRLCRENGVGGIEFDVRWTKDNVPVIHHDKTLKRVFGGPEELKSLEFQDLRSLYPDIPKLSEVVEEFGGKVHLMIEIKDPSDLTVQQQKNLASELAPLKEGVDFHLMSLDLPGLSLLPLLPSSKVGISILNPQAVSDDVEKFGFAGYTGAYFLIEGSQLNFHKKKGRTIGTGFVSNTSVFNYEINRGVRWIFTNDAVKIQRHLDQLLS